MKIQLLCIGVLSLGLGCRSISPDLEPADPTQEVATGKDAAMDRSDGMRLIVQTTPWPGQHLIEMEVTPVRVHIANDSSRAVAVRYDDFVIVNDPSREDYASFIEDVSYEIENGNEEPARPSFADLNGAVEPSSDEPFLPTLEEAEHDLITRALKHFDGNRRQTAKALGISERAEVLGVNSNGERLATTLLDQ